MLDIMFNHTDYPESLISFPHIGRSFTGYLFSENIVMLKKIETKFYLTLQSGEISFQIFQDNDKL